MERAVEIVSERVAGVYDEAFADLEWLRSPACLPGYEHGYQSYPCMFRPDDLGLGNVRAVNIARNEWMEELQRLGFPPDRDSCCAHVDLLQK